MSEGAVYTKPVTISNEIWSDGQSPSTARGEAVGNNNLDQQVQNFTKNYHVFSPDVTNVASSSFTCLADPILALGMGSGLSPATPPKTTKKVIEMATENFIVGDFT